MTSCDVISRRFGSQPFTVTECDGQTAGRRPFPPASPATHELVEHRIPVAVLRVCFRQLAILAGLVSDRTRDLQVAKEKAEAAVLAKNESIAELRVAQDQIAGERARFKFIFEAVPVGISLIQPGADRIILVIMLADEHPEMDALAPSSVGGSPVGLHLYVEDVDAVVARAVAAGAKLLHPVEDKFYGDRNGFIQDPFGHLWGIATHVEDVSPKDMEDRMKKMMQKPRIIRLHIAHLASHAGEALAEA